MSYNPSPTPTLAQLDMHATNGTRLPTSLSYADDEKKAGLGEASSVLPPPASAENEVDASAARCEKGDDSMQEDEVEAIVGDPVAAAAADAGIYFPGDEGTLRAWLVVLGALHITCCTFGEQRGGGLCEMTARSATDQGNSSSLLSTWLFSVILRRHEFMGCPPKLLQNESFAKLERILDVSHRSLPLPIAQSARD